MKHKPIDQLEVEAMPTRTVEGEFGIAFGTGRKDQPEILANVDHAVVRLATAKGGPILCLSVLTEIMGEPHGVVTMDLQTAKLLAHAINDLCG